MTTPDIEKGGFLPVNEAIHVSSVAPHSDQSHPSNDEHKTQTNQSYSDCIEGWSAEFFNRIQLLPEHELTRFNMRTRVLEFRKLSRFQITYLEWMLLHEMKAFNHELKDPVGAKAMLERIGKMLHDYGKIDFVSGFSVLIHSSQRCARFGVFAST
jgi:hypothetical protein